MILYELTNMVVNSHDKCSIFDNNKEEVIFNGEIWEIPDILLERKITSWEIIESVIVFNID